MRRILFSLGSILTAAAAVVGQRSEPAPAELAGVGITEKLNKTIPLELAFRDESGRRVRLADLFGRGRPVVLTLNYSSCPMLCSLQLNGFVEALRALEWSAGREFDLLTVSIDPEEEPERAAATRQRYLDDYGRDGAEKGWRFLTGEEASIRALADAVGFGYRRVPETGEYAHAAALMVLSPAGRVCRYLYGVDYDPGTLRLALVEAGEGKVGSTLDRILLFCFQYDATTGRYAPAAFVLMRIGGGLTVIAIAVWLLVLRRKRAFGQRRPRADAVAVG